MAFARQEAPHSWLQSQLPSSNYIVLQGRGRSHSQGSLKRAYPSNQNLTPTQKIWQCWHFKLGHITYSHIQKLALGGFLDRVSMGLLRTKIAGHPKCSACQFGKQTRLPDETTTTIKREGHLGSLKEGQLKPGDRVFCDQLESRVRGRLLHTAGRKLDKDRFCGATIFVDAASGYIHVEFQVTLNATDSINALDSFERSSLHMGVAVNSYYTDNGIFKSKRFVHEIMKNSQSIRYSGVGSKWQNGVSEEPSPSLRLMPAPL